MSSNYNKIAVFRKEDSYGVTSGTAGSFLVRRNSIDVQRNLEQRTLNTLGALQSPDVVTGSESCSISLNTELSPKIYSEIFKSYAGSVFVKRGSNVITNLTLTGNGLNYNLTGSGITANTYIGDIIKLDGLAVNSTNKTNLVVLSISTNTLLVSPIRNSILVPQSSILAEVLFQGSKSLVNTDNPVVSSFSLENYSDGVTPLSEVYSGVVPSGFDIQAQPNNPCSLDFSFVAQRLVSKGTTQIHTGSSKAESNPVDCNYISVYINGVRTYVTQFNLSSSRGIITKENIGSEYITGYEVSDYSTEVQMTFQLKDWTISNLLNTKVSLIIVLPSANNEYISFCIPVAKVLSCSQDDSSILMSNIKLQCLLEDKPNYNYSSLIINDSSDVVNSWEDTDVWNDSNIWQD